MHRREAAAAAAAALPWRPLTNNVSAADARWLAARPFVLRGHIARTSQRSLAHSPTTSTASYCQIRSTANTTQNVLAPSRRRRYPSVYLTAMKLKLSMQLWLASPLISRPSSPSIRQPDYRTTSARAVGRTTPARRQIPAKISSVRPSRSCSRASLSSMRV